MSGEQKKDPKKDQKKDESDKHGNASLAFYILNGILRGTIGEKTVAMPMYSGGGGGSTKNKPDPSVNDPRETTLKTKEKPHVHGGPLPTGWYSVRKPRIGSDGGGIPGRCAKLVPDADNAMHDRDAFYIHGRGPHGSDGCLVPKAREDFKTLMDDLEKAAGSKLYAGRLQVFYWERGALIDPKDIKEEDE